MPSHEIRNTASSIHRLEPSLQFRSIAEIKAQLKIIPSNTTWPTQEKTRVVNNATLLKDSNMEKYATANPIRPPPVRAEYKFSAAPASPEPIPVPPRPEMKKQTEEAKRERLFNAALKEFKDSEHSYIDQIKAVSSSLQKLMDFYKNSDDPKFQEKKNNLDAIAAFKTKIDACITSATQFEADLKSASNVSQLGTIMAKNQSYYEDLNKVASDYKKFISWNIDKDRMNPEIKLTGQERNITQFNAIAIIQRGPRHELLLREMQNNAKNPTEKAILQKTIDTVKYKLNDDFLLKEQSANKLKTAKNYFDAKIGVSELDSKTHASLVVDIKYKPEQTNAKLIDYYVKTLTEISEPSKKSPFPYKQNRESYLQFMQDNEKEFVQLMKLSPEKLGPLITRALKVYVEDAIKTKTATPEKLQFARRLSEETQAQLANLKTKTTFKTEQQVLRKNLSKIDKQLSRIDKKARRATI